MHSFRPPPLALAPALLIMALMAPNAHATQWKWRDADGRVQYSDRPPPSHVADKDILTRPALVVRTAAINAASAASAPSATLARPAPNASDPELEAKKRKADEEMEAQRKTEEAQRAKTRAQDCERARGYQKSLSDGMRIARTNAKGEREVLDDQARAEETARNRKVIDAACK